MRAIALTAALLACTPLHAAKRENTVPARFQGEWNSKLRDCGTAMNDSRLQISASRISGYESSGTIRAVVTEGTRDLALIAEMSGEGEKWLSLRHYRLDARQRTLTDVTNEASPVALQRCPVKRR